jgi:exodeoxyribonuclease V gamma subunit
MNAPLPPAAPPNRPQPGLLVLHGNRLEQLAEAVFAFIARHPLGALEEEHFLVQSNGMAEWLKMALAGAQGVCAATRVELPARFVWRAYRTVLGRSAVPAVSALDKLPLTWRLMGLLPGLAGRPGFEPVAGFLGRDGAAGDATRRLQLALRLADLFDQYQVYRSDWLQAWAAGDDRLGRQPLPPGQAWQPALWRELLAALPAPEQAATRPWLHQRFLQALGQPGGAAAGLPPRLVLFGTTHLPHQTLEAIAALAGQVQVLLAVPNPCRYHWADIIDGRELLQAARRRHPLRAGTELAAVPLPQMHQHGPALLAAWGRQARDFVRQLDVFDDVQLARQRFAWPRVDLFDEAPGQTLLQQLQAQIRDLVPTADAAAEALPPAPGDRSIVFHIAHSAQREVEVLHDQLLHLLAQPPAPGEVALQPRDIVVMVPDIESFAPAIQAVFGQHPRSHPRHIPWGLADQRERGRHPLLLALEWLLRAPQQRHSFSELQGLLEVPALARRFGITSEDLPTLLAWAEGAGVRWGLHEAQREGLGLQACGPANTWQFGLQRLLLGYATGALAAPTGHAGVEPYAEVAGLSAGLAGALAELVDRLQAWWADSQQPRAPEAWAQRLRQLLQDLFKAGSDDERALLAALDEALAQWLQACEAAAFSAALPLAVVREAWLDAVDEPGLSRRFRAGGVTFCTLLPLRAIPFEVVCLLGMNDGDYPRRSTRSDFDLMAVPGQARPGDRSRRHDDRQLMLDALLSARRVLYLSWAGRSVRDNQAQPPSVLVAQLRDHLAAVWGASVLAERSTEHPLQPFSRRYFEAPADGAAAAARPAGLFTYAAEWRSAHESTAVAGPLATALAPAPPVLPALTLDALAAFLKNPVQAYFRQRLQVRFDERPEPVADDESFAAAGLGRWQLMDEVLAAARRAAGEAPLAADTWVPAQVARLQRAGQLPLAGPGQQVQAELVATLQPMVQHWLVLQARHPQPLPPLALRLGHPDRPALALGEGLGDGLGDGLDEGLSGLRAAAEPGAPPVFIELQASRLADRSGKHLRASQLLKPWLRGLAAAAAGQPAAGIVIGADRVVHLAAATPEAARNTLLALMAAWAEAQASSQPWPTALNTGLAWLKNPETAAAVYDGSSFGGGGGEGREACLARLYPDFATLAAQPGFEDATVRLYSALREALATQLHSEDLPGQALPDEADGDD